MIEIESEVKNLEKKAEMTRSIHVFCSNKCKFWIDSFLVLTVILTILIALLSLVVPQLITFNNTDESIFAIIIAIASLAILFLSVSDRIFGLNERYASHIQGVKLLTDFIRECHQFRHVDIIKQDENKNLAKLNELRNDYSHINHWLPMANTSDREFLKCKQDLFLKIEVSKKLETDPHLNIDEALKTHNSGETRQ